MKQGVDKALQSKPLRMRFDTGLHLVTHGCLPSLHKSWYHQEGALLRHHPEKLRSAFEFRAEGPGLKVSRSAVRRSPPLAALIQATLRRSQTGVDKTTVVR